MSGKAPRESDLVKTWRVVIDRFQPTKLNQLLSRHWATRNRLKNIDGWVIGLAVREVPCATTKRRVTLTIVLGPRQRGGDVDAYQKATLDALVACGRLKDDSKEWCEIAPVKYERGPRRATVIELEDIA